MRVLVHDASGRLVRTLVDEEAGPGSYTAAWDGTDDAGQRLPGGTYFYQLTTQDELQTRKALILR